MVSHIPERANMGYDKVPNRLPDDKVAVEAISHSFVCELPWHGASAPVNACNSEADSRTLSKFVREKERSGPLVHI